MLSWFSENFKDTVIKVVKDMDETADMVMKTVKERIIAAIKDIRNIVDEMSEATTSIARSSIKMINEVGAIPSKLLLN
ncbi:MAG: hypothetical protein ACQES9_02725 [Myxococcota bacterium]